LDKLTCKKTIQEILKKDINSVQATPKFLQLLAGFQLQHPGLIPAQIMCEW
jgi:hypothetical protein